jgi:CheY-like chemotaxis protein/two-component sensor histidine kinase
MELTRPNPRSPLRVMVVDDDREHREAISLTIEHWGDQVRSYEGAMQAIADLRKGPAPDVILLDLMMPHMDGWEFRLVQKKEPLWANIPIVAMSGVSSAQAAVMDVDAFLEKPIAEQTLQQTLHRVVEAHARQQELARAGEVERLVSLGALLGGISHEINNPLSIVVGSVDLARGYLRRLALSAGHSEAPLLAKSLQALENARGGADRVAAVVRSASLFATADLDHVETVDVHEILESSLQVASNEIRHAAHLVRDLDEVPPVQGNRARLGQVFLNLLLNAVEAIRDSGQRDHIIAVSTKRDERFVLVTVSDTAALLQPLPEATLFDPVGALSETDTRLRFGLAVSRELVQDMGGRIEAQAMAPRGVAYSVWLPIRAAKEPSAPILRSASGSGQGSIMVIDDEPLICEILQAMLSERYDVTTFSSPRAALAALMEREYDAVLCDVMMPDLNGTELFEQAVRARPILRERFVFITGGAFTERAQSFLKDVGRPVLEKPCARAELMATVASIAGTRAALS